MEYNTQRTPLILSEYGRNIQKLAEFIIEIKDINKRTAYAHTLAHLMRQFHPSAVKDRIDDNQRIWDHLHVIANFKLVVDAPFPKPDKSILSKKTG